MYPRQKIPNQSKGDQFTRLESVIRASFYKRSKSIHGYPRQHPLNSSLQSGSGGSSRPATVQALRPIVLSKCRSLVGYKSDRSQIYSSASSSCDQSEISMPSSYQTKSRDWDNLSLCSSNVSSVTSRSGSFHTPSGPTTKNRREEGWNLMELDDSRMEHDGLDELCDNMGRYSLNRSASLRDVTRDGQRQEDHTAMDHDGILGENRMNLFTVNNRMRLAAEEASQAAQEETVADELSADRTECDLNAIDETPTALGRDDEKTDSLLMAKNSGKSFAWYFLLIISAAMALVGVLMIPNLSILHSYHACRDIDMAMWVNFKEALESSLIGQHLARNIILSTLSRFYGFKQGQCPPDVCGETLVELEKSRNVLVLSFHGWTGVGKTFASEIISRHLYAGSTHRIVVPLCLIGNQNNLNLTDWEHWIVGNATRCKSSLLLIDDLDHVTPEFLAVLRSTISKLKSYHGASYKIVILLIGSRMGNRINKATFEYIQSNRHHDDINLSDLKHVFSDGERKDQQSALCNSDIVDFNVPFLPLAKYHAEECIRRDLTSRGISAMPDLVARVVKELSFVTVMDGVQYSLTGCKRITDKVDLHAIQ